VPGVKQLLWRGELSADGPLQPDPALRHRLRKVLRLKAGAAVVLADGRGLTLPCTWTGRELVAAGPITERPMQTPRVTLAAALLKRDRWEWLLEKAVEVGADAIVPLALAHCVAKVPAAKVDERVARWQQRAVDAFEQCGRSHLPRVMPPTDLAGCLGRIDDAAVACCAEPGGTALLSWSAGQAGRAVVLVVGPEGGLSEAERAILAAEGATRVSLGPDVLRAETAAIVALTLARASA